MEVLGAGGVAPPRRAVLLGVHEAAMQLARVPQAFVTRAILRAVRALPGYPDLGVLVSFGRGGIMRELARDACPVRGTHYRPGDDTATAAAGPA